MTLNPRQGGDMAYQHNLANEYTSVGGAALSYHAAGNLSADATYAYQYDHDNRLTKITKDEDPVAEFTYDALGRRIESIDAVAATTTRYYYDGWRVLTETNAAETPAVLRTYVWGNYLDEALIRTTYGDTSRDFYLAHDHLFSPAAVLTWTGGVAERYEYDVYGQRHVFDAYFSPRSTSNYNVAIAFTGQRLDTLDGGDLELMYYKNRHYSPSLGRFLQRDPLGVQDSISLVGFRDGSQPRFGRSVRLKEQLFESANPYLYGRSQPSRFLDTEGLFGGPGMGGAGDLNRALCGMGPSWEVWPCAQICMSTYMDPSAWTNPVETWMNNNQSHVAIMFTSACGTGNTFAYGLYPGQDRGTREGLPATAWRRCWPIYILKCCAAKSNFGMRTELLGKILQSGRPYELFTNNCGSWAYATVNRTPCLCTKFTPLDIWNRERLYNDGKVGACN